MKLLKICIYLVIIFKLVSQCRIVEILLQLLPEIQLFNTKTKLQNLTTVSELTAGIKHVSIIKHVFQCRIIVLYPVAVKLSLYETQVKTLLEIQLCILKELPPSPHCAQNKAKTKLCILMQPGWRALSRPLKISTVHGK